MSLLEAPVVFVPSVELFKAALTQSYLLVPLTKKTGRATIRDRGEGVRNVFSCVSVMS